MQKDILEMSEELQQILSTIKGVEAVQEFVKISYFVQINSEDCREGVEKVAAALEQQAMQHGINLQITAVTLEEINRAKQAMSQQLSEKMLITQAED